MAKGTRNTPGTAGVLVRYLARARDRSPSDQPCKPVPRMTPERAVATALTRAARQSCGLELYPTQVRIGAATLAELSEILPEQALLLVVEGADGDLGVVALCPAMLASVIEMQSLGRVAAHPPRARRGTRTDAAICAGFVNAALAGMAAELAAPGMGDMVPPFRFASFVEDAKPLTLMLDDIAYRSFRLEARIGRAGQREGVLLLMLPEAAGRHVPPGLAMADHPWPGTPAPPAGGVPARLPGTGGAALPGTATSLSRAMAEVPVGLSAVLCRREIPLGDLRALAPGAVLALPRGAMGQVRLEAAGGLLVARGKLGTLHGNRALRIANAPAMTAPPDHGDHDGPQGFAAEPAGADVVSADLAGTGVAGA
ncbi:MAG: FliM/FliN family flagellar motor C-terminal domain-containing protein, partial [Paracoccus sp. (in: a-proteobacteria)]|nr:FliM/FliN family flagellar motor C-terminal domain-containing protein [Paracoccus sp. (in: a-proteobacteria)]